MKIQDSLSLGRIRRREQWPHRVHRKKLGRGPRKSWPPCSGGVIVHISKNQPSISHSQEASEGLREGSVMIFWKIPFPIAAGIDHAILAERTQMGTPLRAWLAAQDRGGALRYVEKPFFPPGIDTVSTAP